MTHVLKSTFTAALLSASALLAAGAAYGQPAPSAHGHWEGELSGPAGAATLQVDIGADAAGKPIVAVSLPGEDLTGLPMRNVKIEGTAISFDLPTAGEGSFSGALSADGRNFSGMLEKPFGSVHFSLERKGEAHFAPAPKNAALERPFVGTWAGVADSDGRKVELRFVLTNTTGGSTGRMEIDGPGVGLPLRIAEKDGMLTLAVIGLGESFSGRIDSTSGQLVGAYSRKAGGDVPLSLTREKD